MIDQLMFYDWQFRVPTEFIIGAVTTLVVIFIWWSNVKIRNKFESFFLVIFFTMALITFVVGWFI